PIRPKSSQIKSYPLLILIAYAAPILYMHKSRIWMREYEPESILDLFSYFHAELLTFLLIALLLSITARFRQFAFFFITIAYYIAVLDWISWSAQSRPLFTDDIPRAIQLLIFYPEFVADIKTVVKIKALMLLTYPLAVKILLSLNATSR